MVADFVFILALITPIMAAIFGFIALLYPIVKPAEQKNYWDGIFESHKTWLQAL